MTNHPNRSRQPSVTVILAGIWFDEDGMQMPDGDKLIGDLRSGAIYDDMGFRWLPDAEGVMRSSKCIASFHPGAGELARIGLA